MGNANLHDRRTYKDVVMSKKGGKRSILAHGDDQNERNIITKERHVNPEERFDGGRTNNHVIVEGIVNELIKEKL